MLNKGRIVLLVAGFVGAPPRVQAACLVSGPNFPVGGGGLIVNSGRAEAAAVPVSTKPRPRPARWWFNPCARGAGSASQKWEIKPSPRPNFGNLKSKLCLDTKSTGELVHLFVSDCSQVTAKGQNWQIK
jgi:hypothetical protein